MNNANGTMWLHTAQVKPEWVDYNGHMSEAYYVLVFGNATDAFYDHVGLDHAYRTRWNVSLYTVEAHIRYLHEAVAGCALKIATQLRAFDSKRLRLHHSMVAADETILAVTEILAVHVDKVILRSSDMHAATQASLAACPLGVPEIPAVSRHWASATT